MQGHQCRGAAVPLRGVNEGSQVQSVSGSMRGGVGWAPWSLYVELKICSRLP